VIALKSPYQTYVEKPVLFVAHNWRLTEGLDLQLKRERRHIRVTASTTHAFVIKGISVRTYAKPTFLLSLFFTETLCNC